MKTVLLSIYDKKAEDFGPVYTSKNRATATREFTSACNDNPNFKNYPEDYALCIVGEFDTTTGIITPATEIKTLAEAEMFVIKEEIPNNEKKN